MSSQAAASRLDDEAVEDLLAHDLAPERDARHVARLVAVAARCADAEEAWESFAAADLIPEAWMNEERDVFDFHQVEIGPARSMLNAISFASDVHGLSRALAQMRELSIAAEVWLYAPNFTSAPGTFAPLSVAGATVARIHELWKERLSMIRGTPANSLKLVNSQGLSNALSCLKRTVAPTHRIWRAWPGVGAHRDLLRAALAWDLAAAEGRKPVGRRDFPSTWGSHGAASFADLRNPFAMLVDVLSLGYAPEIVEPRYEASLLGVPQLDTATLRQGGWPAQPGMGALLNLSPPRR